MPPEQKISADYFETPARIERLQLLLHLVRNAGEVIYLRAPAGAGKTRFAHRLLEILGDETAAVWIRAGEDLDVPAAAVDQLGLTASDAERWPDALLAAVGEQELLVIVDDADRLDLSAVESLALLHERGGRLLLLGLGGLAQTKGDWDVQFVDLPSFDVEQTVSFLRTQAGEDAVCITDGLGAALHRAAHGLPGPLLDALDEVLARARRKPAAKRKRVAEPIPRRRPLWHWLGAAGMVVLLVVALVFQDRINALFQPEPAGMAPSVAETPRGDDRIARDAGQVQESLVLAQGEQPPAAAPDSLPAADAVEPDTAGTSAPVEATVPAEPSAADREPTAVTAAGAEPQNKAQPQETPDPLDAVMRDAFLAAAEQGDAATAEPVISQPAAPPQATAEPPPLPKPPEPAKTVTEKRPEPEQQPPHEVSGALPAPVEERRAAQPEAVTPAQSSKAAVTVAGPRPAEVVSRAEQSGGAAWLESRKPERYTLQLVGSRDRAAIQKFVARHGIKQPYAIFERQLDGKPWFSLVAGEYADRTAALAELPKGLERSGAWPRTFASIQKSK